MYRVKRTIEHTGFIINLMMMMKKITKTTCSSPAVSLVPVASVGFGREQDFDASYVTERHSIEERSAAVLVRTVHIDPLFD